MAEGRQGLLFVGLVDADGSDYVQFDSPDATLNLACSAWSPDASRLACEGWDDADVKRNGIYTVRAADGGGLIRVTTGSGGAHDIPGDYSPDGRQIVFVRGNVSAEADTTLMVVEVDGSDERKLTDQHVGLQSRWSPDGQTILTDANGSLLLVPVDGRETSTIEIASDVSPYSESSAGWSPDGEWVVFSAATSTGSDLYIGHADGTNLHQVTDTPGQWKDGADWSR